MREILFRGKRKDNGEWVEGCLCISCDERVFIVYDEDFTLSSDCCGLHLISDRFFEIIPETVGQFTGLLDKNGAKIFEGDIVREKGTDYTPIYQNGIYMAYNVDKINNPYVSTQFNVIWRNGCKVIGNIHDNRN